MKIIEVLRRMFGAHTASSDQTYPCRGSNRGLIAVLQSVMNSRDIEQTKKLIKLHPEVLSVEADLLLDGGANQRTKEVLRQHRQLFDLCRIHGVDEAFRRVEQDRNAWPLESEVADHFMRALRSENVAELEVAVRKDPRIIEGQWRDMLILFIDAEGTFGMSIGRIQRCLDILESCERFGIDATFQLLNPMTSLLSPDDRN
jgi:hypothetical protein